MDALIGKHNAAAVRKALENLPQGVDETYDEIMVRIAQQSKDDRELATQILSWISYAYRLLNINELQYALAITPGTASIDPDDITNEEVLTSICVGLIVIDEMRIVRLVRKYPII
jgi:hypothetical protein